MMGILGTVTEFGHLGQREREGKEDDEAGESEATAVMVMVMTSSPWRWTQRTLPSFSAHNGPRLTPTCCD